MEAILKTVGQELRLRGIVPGLAWIIFTILALYIILSETAAIIAEKEEI